MDINFDSNAAETLIKQMNTFCSIVYNETKELSGVVNRSSGWKDKKQKQFFQDVELISKDLLQALQMESECLKIFNQRVNELRG